VNGGKRGIPVRLCPNLIDHRFAFQQPGAIRYLRFSKCPSFADGCLDSKAYSQQMDEGQKRSGMIIYIAIAVLVASMAYFFVKAFQSGPQEPHAPVHDSK
jgi:hypothetical protein